MLQSGYSNQETSSFGAAGVCIVSISRTLVAKRDKDNLYTMRIAGVTIPDNKQLAYSLPLIFGIGPTRAREILKTVGVSVTKKGSELTSVEEQKIRILAEGFTIEGELRREIGQNIKRLKDIKSARGDRHSRGLPVRGQRTKTNSRTRRGNVRKTMTSGRRSLEKT